MAKVYVVELENGVEEATSLKEVATLLGVSRVSKSDIESGKYPMVTLQDTEEVQEDIVEDTVVEPTDVAEDVEERTVEEDTVEEDTTDEVVAEDDSTEDSQVEDTVEEDTTEDDTLTDTHEEDVEEDIEYPEVGAFSTEKDMKKYIKKLSDEQLEEWVTLEGCTWKPCDHAAINRMRMAMAIKALHFPELNKPKSKKSKSKYAKYSLEELAQMAIEHDVEIRDSKGDLRIERMYLIMGLRDAGVLD